MNAKVKYIIIALLATVIVGFGYSPVSNVIQKARQAKTLKIERDDLLKSNAKKEQENISLNKQLDKMKESRDSLISMADSSASVQIQLENEINKNKRIIADMRKNLTINELDGFWNDSESREPD